MTRIGKGREPIDLVLAELGIAALASCTPEQQQELLTRVRDIPA